ncbi:MAG: universal stress protein [Fimbriimonadales bacterium]
MMPKVILALIDGGPLSDATLEAALSLAKRFGAQLEVLHVRADPATMISMVGGGIPSAAMVEPAIEVIEEASQERAQRARAAFDRIATKAGAAATWRQEAGLEPVVLAGAARLSDLTVIGRPDATSDSQLPASLEAALFDTGRPVLVVPPTSLRTIGRKIAIAWNGSSKESRAVAAALPFLERTETVTVLTVPAGKRGSSGEALAAYLGLHGVKATVESIDPQGKSIGKALLEDAQGRGVDLLVMGAWGHSRIREMILGGVTREVLTQTTLQVLMAH